jgi:hypothetical protein
MILETLGPPVTPTLQDHESSLTRRQAFVREMVGQDELRNAITLNSVTVNAARAVGPAVGGVLIAIGNSTIQLSAAPSMRGRVIALWQVAFQGRLRSAAR